MPGMEEIKKRARVGWIAGLVVLLIAFGWASLARPTIDGASAAAVSRGGLLTLVGILPVILAGRAISRFTVDNTVAAMILPIFLAAVLGLLMAMFGWMPEDARLCSAFERYGDVFAPDPECYTPMSVRITQLLEALGLWLVFGLVLLGSFRLRERKLLKAASA